VAIAPAQTSGQAISGDHKRNQRGCDEGSRSRESEAVRTVGGPLTLFCLHFVVRTTTAAVSIQSAGSQNDTATSFLVNPYFDMHHFCIYISSYDCLPGYANTILLPAPFLIPKMGSDGAFAKHNQTTQSPAPPLDPEPPTCQVKSSIFRTSKPLFPPKPDSI